MHLTPEVIDVLDTSTIEGNSLVLPSQLERKLYEKVAKALDALGGKWNRKAKAHLFDYDPAEAIEMAVLTGTIVNKKREMGFFETPEQIARQLVALADIQLGDCILEPSAGRGAIAQYLPGTTMLCELDVKNRSYLKEKFPGQVLLCDDFLNLNVKWDKIISNPPFGGAQRDIVHVQHMWDILNPGGRLVSVMSNGITFRTTEKTLKLRQLINLYGTILPLPSRSFHDSGTDVETIIVVMTKP